MVEQAGARAGATPGSAMIHSFPWYRGAAVLSARKLRRGGALALLDLPEVEADVLTPC